MIYSVAMSTEVNQQGRDHLLGTPWQEDLCFALWYPSRGKERFTGLLQKLILPQKDDRMLHGNASFTSQYFEKALSLALENKSGLAFLHSHLGPGWQDMSHDDVVAERRLAPSVQAATGLPLIGLTLGTDGAWSARFWKKNAPREYRRHWCHTVRVVGESYRVTYNDLLVPKVRLRRELSRTVSAWGESEQQQLMRIRVGIVGVGSVGSIVAESLARMGTTNLKLIDFDTVEFVNLDRLLHANKRDALLHRSKVETLARKLHISATANPFRTDPIESSIAEERGFRAALDCDILFSCVDRPWPRSILNFIAYSHLIPVIDGGIHLQTKKSGQGLRGADWRAHVVGPSRPCLECLGQYQSSDAACERDGYFDDPSYIAGLANDHPVKQNENVFAFSLNLASLEVLQFLAISLHLPGDLVHQPQIYHFVTDRFENDCKVCQQACPFPTWIAKGDNAPISFTGRHQSAIKSRTERAKFKRSWRYWLALLANRR
jgi:molybdopterin/thiamine biosynthesis adenylyltransferase